MRLVQERERQWRKPASLTEEFGLQVFILPIAFISGVMFGITCTLKVLHML